MMTKASTAQMSSPVAMRTVTAAFFELAGLDPVGELPASELAVRPTTERIRPR